MRGILTNNEAVCWGMETDFDLINVPGGDTKWATVSSGYMHSCGVTLTTEQFAGEMTSARRQPCQNHLCRQVNIYHSTAYEYIVEFLRRKLIIETYLKIINCFSTKSDTLLRFQLKKRIVT